MQFAKHRGARVIGMASGGKATALVRDLGAAGVFEPRSNEAIEQLRGLGSC